MSFNPVAKWKRGPGGDVHGYAVNWQQNGQPAGGVMVPSSPAGDESGYESRMPVETGEGMNVTVSVTAFGPTGVRSAPAVASLRLEAPAVPPPGTPVELTLSPN